MKLPLKVSSIAVCTIRPYRLSDVANLRLAINDPKIARMTSAIPYPYTLADARKWILGCQREYRQSHSDHRNVAITIDDRVVGSISANRAGDQAELGYWLASARHGQGIMSKVVQTFVPHVFSYWPIDRIIAKTFMFNQASARVLEKNGFTKTAHEIRSVKKGGRWLDTYVYTRWRQ